jgi:hypothetical protein
MKNYRKLLLIVAALAMASCESIFGNDDGSFTFQSQETTFTEGMTDDAFIQPTLGGLRIEGVIVLPSPCYRLEGDQDRSGGNITFTVTAIQTSGTCPGVVQAKQYTVQSLGVTRGFYRVRVLHKVGDESARIIAEENVQVG